MDDKGYEELSTTASSGQTVHHCLPLLRPDRQIRVLDLDPVKGNFPPTKKALSSRLHVLNELTDHEYTALSYAWTPDPEHDPPIPKRENLLIIHCDDHLHKARIKPNCWSALWHLCKIQKKSRTVLWVDSICIDQMNEEEKNQQIPLMRSIYLSAHKTYFWLGEAAPGTNGAMDFLSRDKITSSTGGVRNTFLIGIKIYWQLAKLRPYPHRSGLRKIFGNSWITRLWTFQECLLSREGILVCGEKSVSWKRLECALESIQYFHTHPWALHFDGSYLPWLKLASLTRRFAENRGEALCEASENFNHPLPQVQSHLHCLKWAVRMVSMTVLLGIIAECPFIPLIGLCYFFLSCVSPRGPKKATLFFPRTSPSILEELRKRKAKDPKDMYKGTLGILGEDVSDTGEGLHVVYRRLCTSLICKTRSLDVLLFANTYADTNYCSWVINWTSTVPHLWGQAIYFRDKRRSISPRPPDMWNIESGATNALEVVPWYGPAQEYFFRWSLFLKQELLGQYQGAMPATQPRWNFRDQGQSLCVYGLVLTHISSHLAPAHSKAKVDPLHPLRRVLLSMKTRANFISAKAMRFLQNSIIWFSQKTTDNPIEMIGPQDMRPTTGATHLQAEGSMFISVLYDAFTGMTTEEQLRAQKQLTNLLIVATGERRLERDLRMWWRTLRDAARLLQGKQYLEDRLSTDGYVWHSLISIMRILQEKGLGAVRCEASRSLASPGGLAFATAGARTGDAVALVSGVSFPLVLRPCGQGRFRLIGPIFLPGIMDGELKDQVMRVALNEIILV